MKKGHMATNSRKPKEWVGISNKPNYKCATICVLVLLLKGPTQLPCLFYLALIPLCFALPCSICSTLPMPKTLLLLIALLLLIHFQTLIIPLTTIFPIVVRGLSSTLTNRIKMISRVLLGLGQQHMTVDDHATALFKTKGLHFERFWVSRASSSDGSVHSARGYYNRQCTNV